MAELTTWTEFNTARYAVAEGEIFAVGMNTEDGYEVRLRRHGDDIQAEVREGDGDWALVDSTDGDGVIDLRDIDTEVTYFSIC